MRAHQATYPVATMCRVLGLSKSGYYAWLARQPSKRDQDDARLTSQIVAIFEKSGGRYGAPRIHAELRSQGLFVGRKRVARLMKAQGLVGASRRRRVQTTVRGRERHGIPDLVQREFSATEPDRLWVADITYVPTLAGFLYLAVVLDAFSRKVVGWAMADHLRTELVLEALQMAIDRRQPERVIHHSDQGCQYTSLAFGKRCEEAGIRPSVGTVGDCFDNAMAESFFATLECELLAQHTFRSHAEAKLALFCFIESFYNGQRRHSGLGYLSPADFEQAYFTAQEAA